VNILLLQPIARRRLAIGLMCTMLATAAVPTIAGNLRGANTPDDFAPVYRAAQAMSAGQDIYTATGGLYIYPPFLALLFQPLTLISEHAAAIVWAILSALLFAVAAVAIAGEVAKYWLRSKAAADLSIAWVIATIAILLVGEKIHADLRLGQTDCLILLGFACVLKWMERKPWFAGAAVGATASMKYLSLIFVPYFILKRNYKAAIASIAWFIFFNFIPAVEVGIRGATQFAISALSALVKMAEQPVGKGGGAKIPRITWERSVSITSAITRVTRANQLPDWVAAGIILGCFVLLAAAVLFISQRAGVLLFRPSASQRSESSGAITSLEWSCVIVFALVFSPQTTARHFVLMSAVFVVAAALLFVERQTARRWILLAAMVLTSIGISFPPRQTGINEALWRAVAGASVWAVVLLLVLLAIGGRLAASADEHNCRITKVSKKSPSNFLRNIRRDRFTRKPADGFESTTC
jgi:alpha-1,2-mannosyltransferase